MAQQASAAGFPFRAAVADGAYGDVDDFRCELHAADVPFVMAIRRRRGIWAYAHETHTPVDASRRLCACRECRPCRSGASSTVRQDEHSCCFVSRT
ncbi:transposase [Streptomyces sp. NPDC046925]|uniref:transposase n=1 Tax=Streptomyces sp. NPDC046925 TaxID=3155375 RepID=UPI0033C648B2